MVILSLSMIGLRTVCQFIHQKNKIIMRSQTMKLLFLVAVLYILFISTNTAVGLNLTTTGNTQFAFFGEIINYDYKIVNDGGVDLHDVVFNDDHFGSIAIGALSKGASWTHSLNHTIDEDDMPGPLTNKAFATGKKPDGSDVSSPVASWHVSLAINGSLTVSIAPDKGSRKVGEKVTYSVSVRNTYPVALTNLSITDAIYHPSAIALPITLNRTSLAPNQTAFGTVFYTVVQEDIRGPPLGITGYGSAKVTDTANAIARLPWWNPANPDDQLAVDESFITIDVD
jgi:hypothetical protein